MSLWDDITEKVGAGSKVVADKAKEVSELANIRAQIVSCDNTLVKNYKELGKAYFEAHKNDLDPEFADIMNIIREASDRKADLSDQLAERKSAKGSADTVVDDIDKAVDNVSETVSDAAQAVADKVMEVTDSISD